MATGPQDPARIFDDSRIVPGHYPDWFKRSFLDLAVDLDEAVAAGKQGVLLFFDTGGCAYCAAFLKHSLSDRHISETLRRHFDVIGLDIFQDDEMTDFSGETLRVKAFAKREGAYA